MPTGEVVVTTVVGLPLERAFGAFTDDIDRWWTAVDDPRSTVRFDGDRLVAVSAVGVAVLAKVASWQPPDRLELEWLGPHGQPGDTVIVDFEPEGELTRVTVRHRRSGLTPQAFESALIGLWWGGVLQRLMLANRPAPHARG